MGKGKIKQKEGGMGGIPHKSKGDRVVAWFSLHNGNEMNQRNRAGMRWECNGNELGAIWG